MGSGDFLAELRQAFRLNGIETCIKNSLVLSRRRKNMKDEQEQLTYMRKAQVRLLSYTQDNSKSFNNYYLIGNRPTLNDE